MRNILKLALLLLFSSFLTAQEMSISGTVSDASGPLPGVNIVINDTTTGTTTDFDGNYKMIAQKGDTLHFSYIGMLSAAIVVKDQLIIDVLMEPSSDTLDEVVVVGYGKTKRVYAAAAAVAGKTPGIVIRGASSITKTTDTNLPRHGTLTAGEINDVNKWSEWMRIAKSEYEQRWGFTWKYKADVVVKDVRDKPLVNVTVKLYDAKNTLVSQMKTDMKGRAVLVYEKLHIQRTEDFVAKVVFDDKVYGRILKKKSENVEFVLPIKSNCEAAVDIMFTIDATGSMSDEIAYLQSELNYILQNIDQRIKEKRVGLVFYRDRLDEYLVRDFEFSSNLSEVQSHLNAQNAAGGGDFEEAVEEALKVSVAAEWNTKASARLLFLILDAPPHFTQENVSIIQNQIKLAKEKGIKIIPIVASGADKELEFLMRFFSVATNGTYVFLTDDSGVGNTHLKPTTADFKVEKLNELMIRLINKYSNS